MVLTGNRSRRTGPRCGGSAAGPDTVADPATPRPGGRALGAVLVIGLGAAFGYLYSTAGSKEPVVVVTAPVAVGEVIDRSDLSTVDVAGDITAIAGANLESVVGAAGRGRAAAGHVAAAVDGHRRGPDPGRAWRRSGWR